MFVKCMEKVGKQEGVWGQIAGVGMAGPGGQGRDTAATCEQDRTSHLGGLDGLCLSLLASR